MKTQIFKGGFLKKQYIGGIAWKKGAWTVYKFNWGLGVKDWVVCLSDVDTPVLTMI